MISIRNRFIEVINGRKGNRRCKEANYLSRLSGISDEVWLARDNSIDEITSRHGLVLSGAPIFRELCAQLLEILDIVVIRGIIIYT